MPDFAQILEEQVHDPDVGIALFRMAQPRMETFDFLQDSRIPVSVFFQLFEEDQYLGEFIDQFLRFYEKKTLFRISDSIRLIFVWDCRIATRGFFHCWFFHDGSLICSHWF